MRPTCDKYATSQVKYRCLNCGFQSNKSSDFTGVGIEGRPRCKDRIRCNQQWLTNRKNKVYEEMQKVKEEDEYIPENVAWKPITLNCWADE